MEVLFMKSPPIAILSLIMVLAGIGIPVMAALNGGLGARLGNPVQAATLLFALAFASSTVVLLIQTKPIALNIETVPPQYFLGGLFVAVYVLSVTFIAPKLGVGNSIVLVLLGQALASATIDHYGWLGAQQTAITHSHGIGLLLIISGVLLTRLSIDSD
jgi:transporter family-2 protein